MWIFVFVFAFAISSCSAATEFSSRPTNVSILLLHFTHQATQAPVVLAPFGIWSLMAGVSFGAVGDTNREIFRALLLLTDRKKFNEQYKTLTDLLFQVNTKGVRISNINYCFMDQTDISIDSSFKDMLKNDYNTSFWDIDFRDPIAAAERANWIIRATNSIDEVSVSDIFHRDDFVNSSIIMSNIMIFSGEWSSPFNKSNTALERINSYDGKDGRVNMMHMTAKVRSSHMESMQATVTELPYGNDGKYCMLLLSPDPNVNISEMYLNFERVTFRHMFAKLQSNEDEFGLKEIDVKLPKFVKRSKLQLQGPLNNMGIYDAFQSTHAKFAKIARESIYIEAIEHHAIVAVTESGTRALGTMPGVSVDTRGLGDNVIMPSLAFFIIEKPTATVIFEGIF